MRSYSLALVASLSLLCPRSAAQTATTPTLRQLAKSSGYIFAGTVTAIKRVPSMQADAVDTMRITFHVDEGVKGTRSHQSLTIREWSGLWTAGEKYQIGEQVVVMLYPPSKVGLTSPVAGTLGRFALDRSGGLALHPQQAETVAADPVAGRWLQGQSHLRGHDFVRILRRVAKE